MRIPYLSTCHSLASVITFKNHIQHISCAWTGTRAGVAIVSVSPMYKTQGVATLTSFRTSHLQGVSLSSLQVSGSRLGSTAGASMSPNTTASTTRYFTSLTQASYSSYGRKLSVVVTADEDGMRLDRLLKHRLQDYQQDRSRRNHKASSLSTVSASSGSKTSGVSDPLSINGTMVHKWIRKKQVKLQTQAPLFWRIPGRDTVPGDDPATPVVKLGSVKADLNTRVQQGQLWVLSLPPWVHLRTTQDEYGASKSSSTVGSSARDQAQMDQPGKKDRKQRSSKASASANGTTPISHDVAVSEELGLKDWIVYEDERIVVLNKPVGVAVQGGSGIQASIDGSCHVLQGAEVEQLRLVHRLDMTTSGILVLAKTRKAAQDLTARFHQRTTGDGMKGAEAVDQEDGAMIQKKYIAIVGSKKPIGTRAAFKDSEVRSGKLLTLTGDMTETTQDKVQRITILSKGSGPSMALIQGSRGKTPVKVWPSETGVRIASQSSQDGLHWGLVYLYPRTGRKHQLRVHCAQLLGAPILGDEKYARHLFEDRGIVSSRIYLHMAELTLKDWKKNVEESGQDTHQQVSDKDLILQAPIPEQMRAEMERLGLTL